MTRTLDALVVGAGFAGLYMLHRLRTAGFDAHVVEAGSGVGGTWYWNRYPGARCDIPSVEYSYSFSPDLERDWRWTERYAAQPEILSYLEHVADRFDLTRDIGFDTRVTRAVWHDDDAAWHVATDTGAAFVARHVILATGALSAPKTPDLPGLDRFAGPILHTAAWDDAASLGGKHVALFGTGSSGIQVLPQLAAVAASVTVFQRTPNFAVPAGNRPLDDAELADLVPKLPALRAAARQSPLGWFDGPGAGSAKADDDASRATRFGDYWAEGTTGLLRAYEDLLFDEESNAHAASFARGKIAELVRDPDTARKVTPTGYPIGARRLCSEIGYYDALNRDNVAVVDVREEPVVAVDAVTIRTDRASYPVDTIVFATGFDACVGAVRAIDIRGRDGVALAEEWADGPRAFLGLAVAGFPNLFTVTGPGSPSVLSNVVVSIEQHVDWIADCLTHLRATGATTIEAESAAEQDWLEHVDAVAQQTVFPRADSWYQARTRDGRRVFMPYVGGVGAYREKCDSIAAAGYEGFTLKGATA